MPDAQIEYYFNAAKALGAKAITRELSEEAAEKVGPMADEAGVIVAFHNHTQMTPTTYDGPMLSHGKNLMINFGCTGGQHRSIYCAEKMKEILQRRYGQDIEILIHHREEEMKKMGL